MSCTLPHLRRKQQGRVRSLPVFAPPRQSASSARKQKGRVKPSPIPATSSQNNKKTKKEKCGHTCCARCTSRPLPHLRRKQQGMIPPRFCHLACQPGRKQKGRVKPSPIPATSSQNNKKDKKKSVGTPVVPAALVVVCV